MNVFILGAHPDDPGSGCGGLAVRCRQAGHDVVFVYGTVFRPERQYFGRTEREVRTAEALEACAELKHQALLCHHSQDGEVVWQDHEVMHRFRGRECGVERAEAYIRIDRRGTAPIDLPGLVA